MKRVIIYARVSTDEQVEKYGLPAQIRACRDYATSRGWEVTMEISDEGLTGAILERPGLERLRELVRAGTADVVLTLDPDRLSREPVHLLILKPEIEAHAALEFVTGSFEKTPSGELFFLLKGAIAKYERAVTRDRTMRGKRERARLGLRVGGREPYGYRDEQGKYVIEEPAASVVRQMFGWYDAGMSLREISRQLRNLGAPTWGGGLWWYTSVRVILRNELYIGVARWGKERIELPAPPLVSREQWERVQARLAANPRCGRPTGAFLFKVLYCGCGLRMYGQATHSSGRNGARLYYYRCRGANSLMPADRRCNASVGAPRLDGVAWQALANALADGDTLRSLIAEHQVGLKVEDPAHLEQLAAQARKLRGREESAVELLLDPDLASERLAIKRRLAETRIERARIESEIAAAARVTSIRSGSWVDEAAQTIREYIEGIETMQDRQRFLGGLIERAEWNGQELTMRCFLAQELNTSSSHNEQFPGVKFVLNVRLAA